MNKYPSIFKPCRVGNIIIKNRIILPAMGTGLTTADGEITDHFIAYYKARAKGGVGLIIVEVTPVNYINGKSGIASPRVDNIKYLYGWQKLADAVHPFGTKIFAQIQHPGNQSQMRFNEGNELVSPSGIQSKVLPDKPRELNNKEIKDLVRQFVDGAVLLFNAGFDGIELHGAHGYLVNQFFSPYTNRRTDEYGGTFENRMRFGEEIVRGIRAACGKDFAISIRLTLDEFTEYGYGLDEGLKIAKHFADVGVDMISASNGTYESMETNLEPVQYEQGWRVYLAEEVKKVVDIPVVAVGGIREPQIVENILVSEKADFVAIGRGLMAEPDWVEKVRLGKENELRKCISCCHCFEELNKGHIITCALNPEKGREFEFGELKITGDKRKVIVVGGGPAGMETARILAQRKFDVILMEKGRRLGGQLNAAASPVGKDKLRWFIEYQTAMLEKLKVDIRLNCTADTELIVKEQPYVVFIATGGTPFIPKIDGIEYQHVVTAEECLSKYSSYTDKTVVVVGGGMTGCETAVSLATAGNKVTIVEMQPEICPESFIVNKVEIMKEISQNNVDVITEKKVTKILENQVVLESADGSTSYLAANLVVISLGVRPVNELYFSLAEELEHVFLIGDARKTGKIFDATYTGHVLARELV